MEMPPKNNRQTSGNNPKSRGTSSRVTRRRRLVVRYALPLGLIVGGVLCLAIALAHVVHFTFSSPSAQVLPISSVLNMADRHQLKAVTISGNEIDAQGVNGKLYQTVKENGQSVTDLFRHDGVEVSVDDGQQNQLAQGVVDMLL